MSGMRVVSSPIQRKGWGGTPGTDELSEYCLRRNLKCHALLVVTAHIGYAEDIGIRIQYEAAYYICPIVAAGKVVQLVKIQLPLEAVSLKAEPFP